MDDPAMDDATDQPGSDAPAFDLGLPASPQAATGAAYRVLARKYRPQVFDDLIGQEAMVRTLANAFAAGRIAQAWLFTGVRGVGKTTTARILARALNYEVPGAVDKPSIALDRLGRHCQAIMEGRHVDVMEIDAASHTGVDDVRQITDGARYAPVSARYKVYIVDEVHMLSEKAWNAFLKTLEEPPAHVKFMFATTEIRKVPVTVLSRCQRFDLRRVDADVVMRHLSGICAKEGVAAEADALALIARAGEGSVRDSLSILDQAIAHGAGRVEAAEVRRMLGLADRGRIVDLFEHVMRGAMPAALGELKSLYDDGADPATVLADLASFVHFVTRVKITAEAALDPTLSESERTRGRLFADGLSHRVLARAWQMLMKAIEETERSPRPFASAEMALIRLAYAADLPTPDEALKMLASGRETAAATPAPRPPSGGGEGGARNLAAVQMRAEPRPAPAPAPRAESAPAPARALARFEDAVALAAEKRDLILKGQLERDVRVVRFEDGRLDMAPARGASPTLAGDIQRKLTDWTGRRWMVAVVAEPGEATVKERRDAEKAERERGVLADPAVQAVLERFPGAEVVAVRAFDDNGAEAPAPAVDADLDLDDSLEPVAPWDDDF